MSASASYSKTITIRLQFNTPCALFALTSPELPGLLMAGKDPGKLLEDVPAVIKAMYRVGCNMDVEVIMDTPLQTDGDDFIPLPPTTFAKVEPIHA